MVDCESLDEAIEIARSLAGETGAHEIRPVLWFNGKGYVR